MLAGPEVQAIVDTSGLYDEWVETSFAHRVLCVRINEIER